MIPMKEDKENTGDKLVSDTFRNTITYMPHMSYMCHWWNKNSLPCQSTRVHPRSLVLCAVYCRSLFVLFLLAIALSVSPIYEF